MRKQVVHLITLFAILSMQGCFTIKSSDFITSEPGSIPQVEVKGVGTCGKIENPDYTLLIKTYNTSATIESTCVGSLLLIPLVVKHKEEADFASMKRDEVYVDLGFLVKGRDAFLLSDVEMLYLDRVLVPTTRYRDLFLPAEVQGEKQTYRWTRVVFPITDFDPHNKFLLSLKVVNPEGSGSSSHKIEYLPKKMHETGQYGEGGC